MLLWCLRCTLSRLEYTCTRKTSINLPQMYALQRRWVGRSRSVPDVACASDLLLTEVLLPPTTTFSRALFFEP